MLDLRDRLRSPIYNHLARGDVEDADSPTRGLSGVVVVE